MCQKHYPLFECGHAKVVYEFLCTNKAGLEEVCPAKKWESVISKESMKTPEPGTCPDCPYEDREAKLFS